MTTVTVCLPECGLKGGGGEGGIGRGGVGGWREERERENVRGRGWCGADTGVQRGGSQVTVKVTHNTCILHLVSIFQNSSKQTKPFIENSTSLW